MEEEQVPLRTTDEPAGNSTLAAPSRGVYKTPSDSRLIDLKQTIGGRSRSEQNPGIEEESWHEHEQRGGFKLPPAILSDDNLMSRYDRGKPAIQLQESEDDSDNDVTSPMMQKNTGGPSVLRSYFESFNLTAMAADRFDAVFESIPPEAEARFKSEANFFFSNVVEVPDPNQGGPSTLSRRLKSISTRGDNASIANHGVGIPASDSMSRKPSAFSLSVLTSTGMKKSESHGSVLGSGQGPKSMVKCTSLANVVNAPPLKNQEIFSPADNLLKSSVAADDELDAGAKPNPSGAVKPSVKANIVQLTALSISAVISGEFSGWNSALKEGGFGGLIASTWISASMYLALVLCLAEMALSIPVLGGIFGFSRAVAGDWIALIVGNSEGLEYIMFISLIFVQLGNVICELLGIDRLTFSPIIWVIFSIFCIVIISLPGSGSWDFMTVLTGVCLVQIAAFCITVAITAFDPSMMVSVKNGKQTIFVDGTIGVLNAVPRAAWWFTGVEVIALASTECKDSHKTIPISFLAGWGILFLCGAVLSVFNVLTPPGINQIALSNWPMVDVFQTNFGAQWRAPGIGLMLPCMIVNGVALVWSASRQTWALSRAGFARIPIRAAVFSCIYAGVMAAISVYLPKIFQNSFFKVDTETEHVLLDLTVLSALMTYLGVAVVFLLFRFRHPHAPRPFRSPLGIWGGILLFGITGMVIIEQMGVKKTPYLVTMCTYTVKMVGSVSYYALKGRMHSLPTEDALIYLFWSKERKRTLSRQKVVERSESRK
ncbi:hypothetical protein HDU96_006036 [Phlyctochytrium bullatum]|nr:hypothetical protein HDU96_006036 [Phlyctochytrium bullatum]